MRKQIFTAISLIAILLSIASSLVLFYIIDATIQKKEINQSWFIPASVVFFPIVINLATSYIYDVLKSNQNTGILINQIMNIIPEGDYSSVKHEISTAKVNLFIYMIAGSTLYAEVYDALSKNRRLKATVVIPCPEGDIFKDDKLFSSLTIHSMRSNEEAAKNAIINYHELSKRNGFNIEVRATEMFPTSALILIDERYLRVIPYIGGMPERLVLDFPDITKNATLRHMNDVVKYILDRSKKVREIHHVDSKIEIIYDD